MSHREENESRRPRADAIDDDAQEPRLGLNLRQIEVFRAIMLTGSVSGAGRMLHVSQPAISRVLWLTEDRLGLRLFERERGRLAPTAEARRLYAEVESVYRGVERVNVLARNLARHGDGTLKVVASASYGERLIPRALNRLVARHPGIQVSFRNVTYDDISARFLSGDADIGVSMTAPDQTHLSAEPVGADPLVCLLPPGHPLADETVIDPQALAQTPWIGYPLKAPLGRALIDWMGETAAASSRIEVHSPITAASFAQQGLGAALVVQWSLPTALAAGMRVRPLAPAATAGVWAVSSRLEPTPLLARRFLTILRATLKAGPGLPGLSRPD